MLFPQPSGQRPRRFVQHWRPFEGGWGDNDRRVGWTLDIGIQTAFHRFAVTQDAPVRNAQLGRSSAAQVARDPARLDEGVAADLHPVFGELYSVVATPR